MAQKMRDLQSENDDLRAENARLRREHFRVVMSETEAKMDLHEAWRVVECLEKELRDVRKASKEEK